MDVNTENADMVARALDHQQAIMRDLIALIHVLLDADSLFT